MARTKGMLNLSGNLEVNAGAPLDARTVVPTVADLTNASNFQYKYIGMPVVVQATGDMYILTANDVTVAANWKQVGSGGGGSSYTAGDGIDITNDEISVKAGSNLSFDSSGNLNATDTTYTAGTNVSISNQNVISATDTTYTAGTGIDITNNVISATGGGGISYTAGDGIVIEDDEISTDNMPAADMSEIVTPLPSVMSRLPVLFDETGTEQVVGWYKYANGTKKPVYEKTIIDTVPAVNTVKYIPLNVSVDYGYVESGTVYLTEEKSIQSFAGVGINNSFNQFTKVSIIPNENTADTPNSLYIKTNIVAWVGDILKIVVRYTKTTDTPV